MILGVWAEKFCRERWETAPACLENWPKMLMSKKKCRSPPPPPPPLPLLISFFRTLATSEAGGGPTKTNPVCTPIFRLGFLPMISFIIFLPAQSSGSAQNMVSVWPSPLAVHCSLQKAFQAAKSIHYAIMYNYSNFNIIHIIKYFIYIWHW